MNRLDKERCVSCGMDLLFPFNEFRACSQCTKKILKVQYQTKMRDTKGKKPSVVLIGNNFRFTTEPLGDKA